MRQDRPEAPSSPDRPVGRGLAAFSTGISRQTCPPSTEDRPRSRVSGGTEPIWGMSVQIDHIVHATGSCGTQAGLVAAMLASNSGIQVTGISVSRSAAELVPLATELTQAVLDRLQIRAGVPKDSITIKDGYVGGGYGQPTPAMIEAVQLAASEEASYWTPSILAKRWLGWSTSFVPGILALARRSCFFIQAAHRLSSPTERRLSQPSCVRVANRSDLLLPPIAAGRA